VTEYPTGEGARPDVENVPLGTLLSEVTDDLSRLMRQELELAKAELRQEAAKTGKGIGMVGGAGVGATLLLVFASLALMFGLGAVMPLGWAALIVAALWLIISALLFMTGRRTLRRVSPVPEQTIETVKEDVQWARTRTN
jgi:tetrahydromethanopterin S-methyltransferase subunit G